MARGFKPHGFKIGISIIQKWWKEDSKQKPISRKKDFCYKTSKKLLYACDETTGSMFLLGFHFTKRSCKRTKKKASVSCNDHGINE
jgi:hypothetical protein